MPILDVGPPLNKQPPVASPSHKRPLVGELQQSLLTKPRALPVHSCVTFCIDLVDGKEAAQRQQQLLHLEDAAATDTEKRLLLRPLQRDGDWTALAEETDASSGDCFSSCNSQPHNIRSARDAVATQHLVVADILRVRLEGACSLAVAAAVVVRNRADSCAEADDETSHRC